MEKERRGKKGKKREKEREQAAPTPNSCYVIKSQHRRSLSSDKVVAKSSNILFPLVGCLKYDKRDLYKRTYWKYNIARRKEIYSCNCKQPAIDWDTTAPFSISMQSTFKVNVKKTIVTVLDVRISHWCQYIVVTYIFVHLTALTIPNQKSVIIIRSICMKDNEKLLTSTKNIWIVELIKN